jgi:hypothetical protein
MRPAGVLLVLVLPVLAFAQAADIGSVNALVGEALVSQREMGRTAWTRAAALGPEIFTD